MLNSSTIGLNTINDFNQIKYLNNKQATSFVEQNKDRIEKSYSPEKTKEVTQEFESLLIYEMFKIMNKNISFNDENNSEETFLKKNQTEKIFEDFLTYEKSKIISSDNNFNLGLAEAIIKQFQ